MIKAVLVFNNHGKPRLSKFYEDKVSKAHPNLIKLSFIEKCILFCSALCSHQFRCNGSFICSTCFSASSNAPSLFSWHGIWHLRARFISFISYFFARMKNEERGRDGGEKETKIIYRTLNEPVLSICLCMPSRDPNGLRRVAHSCTFIHLQRQIHRYDEWKDFLKTAIYSTRLRPPPSPILVLVCRPQSEDEQMNIIRECFQLVSKRPDNVCNFLEGGDLIGGKDSKLIYRHYATLYGIYGIYSIYVCVCVCVCASHAYGHVCCAVLCGMVSCRGLVCTAWQHGTPH